MVLRFGVCALCSESHALRFNGGMSIHTTEMGERCPGTHDDSVAMPSKPAPVEVGIRRKNVHRSFAERDRERQEEMDPDLKSAFVSAQYRRNAIDPSEPKKKDQPIVYVVKGAHAVSGGLPTLGKNR